MKNHTDVLIFHTQICAGASQICLMADANLKFASPRRVKRSGMEVVMEIGIERNGSTLEIKLTDRLDTVTSPQLEEKLKEELEGVTNLQFNFAELEYISSAGLRVLLTASKRMKKQGKMEIRNVNEEVMEVFIITGFADILTIL